MVSSISSNAEDSIQQMMAQMFQKIGTADTDGVSGLSKDELSSIGSSDDAGSSAFLKSLSEQFDSLDADGNGQLSAKEIASAKPPSEPMGMPPGLSIGSSDDDSNSDLIDALKASAEKEASSTSNTSDSNESLADIAEQLVKSLMESFSESYNKDSTSASDKKDESDTIASVISGADAVGDSDGKVSLDELSALNKSGGTDFSKDLMQNFKSYDTNSDGELSADEMKLAFEKPDKQFSSQELASLNEKASELGSTLGSASSSFVQKLLSNYQAGDVSNLVSSLSMAI